VNGISEDENKSGEMTPQLYMEKIPGESKITHLCGQIPAFIG